MRVAILAFLASGVFFPTGLAFAADPPTNEPRPIPLTRPQMKQLLEDMKLRKPRIPLPELTDEDKKQLGDRANSYESRLRHHYMPGSGDGRGSGFSFGPTGGEATLDNTFKVQLFWLVSRANNCQYCQGHQEGKLLRAGQKEDEIAALDGDWKEFTEAQKAAFAFARKFTLEPHKLSDADIAGLLKHYEDVQILEMILSMAGNNAINRWKEGAGVPQNAGGVFGKEPAGANGKHTYLTPTSDRFRSSVTMVAPVAFDLKTGEPTRMTVCRRPTLESRDEVEKSLAAAAKRTPRLESLLLRVKDAEARAIVPDGFPKAPLPQWVRLLATFREQGKSRVAGQWAAEEKGDLKPLLKAQVSWIVARQDRAWYATGEAKKRLRALGQTEDQIYKLDGDWKDFTPSERSMFTLAKNLAASPVVLTDDDVAAAVKLVGPRDVVQLISYVATRASFDRITEAAGLQLEPPGK
jgi:alkylhydroperoxidase family enzyme